MMAGDWLQGPYMYALYAAYGFEHEQIAALFVAGFGSSMIFGTFIGSLADTVGRKNGALAYVVVYALSCATKHFRSYNVLLLGRVLGGVATSLLFSVFDAWLVAEHAQRGFDAAWLSGTFANAQAGNSIVAILAGVVGEWSASLAPMRVVRAGRAGGGADDGAILVGGYCTPFDAAAVFLVVGGFVIALTWRENYGDSEKEGKPNRPVLQQFGESLRKGLQLICRDKRVLLLGFISACFEAAMYAFVFEWTPAVTDPSPGAPKPPYGEIFSVMMICCMAGTRIFTILVETGMPPERFMGGIFTVSALALGVPALLSANPRICLVAFLLFEGCVGAYFPAMGTLKSKIIPDAQRATVYNLFRIPLNLLVLVVLLTKMSTEVIFGAIACLMVVAVLAQHALNAHLLLKQPGPPAGEDTVQLL